MRKFEEGATMQVAHVTRDLDAALRRHWDVFRIGPWDIWDFNPGTVQDYTYRGKPARIRASSPAPGPATPRSS